MTLAFASLAVASFALGALAWRRVPSVAGRIGAVLAFVSGLGMVIAAVFPTDPITTPAASLSADGQLHALGGQLNLTPLAILFVTLGLRRLAFDAPRLRAALWTVVAATLAVSVAFTATAAAAGDGGFGPGVYTGLFGRFMLAGYVAWLVVAAVAVLRPPATPPLIMEKTPFQHT